MIGKRQSMRLKNYDYTLAGAYFVTICTKYRIGANAVIFGNISAGEMLLNEYGEIVKKGWTEIPYHFNNVIIDEFIIMPNHIHGIIVYDDFDRARRASPLQRKPIGTIVGAFKSAITKQINRRLQVQDGSIWQRNYYDHIVRNEKELNEVRRYITDNPTRWDDDRNNPKNI